MSVGSNSRSDDMLEVVKLQLVQRMQDQDERNRAEEQRLHQQQLVQQQQLMMLMIANMSGQSGVTNVASKNLSIAHLTQAGTKTNAPGDIC